MDGSAWPVEFPCCPPSWELPNRVHDVRNRTTAIAPATRTAVANERDRAVRGGLDIMRFSLGRAFGGIGAGRMWAGLDQAGGHCLYGQKRCDVGGGDAFPRLVDGVHPGEGDLRA